jgi:hypothetical protein
MLILARVDGDYADTYLVQSGKDSSEGDGTTTPGWEAELRHYIGMRIESFVLRQQVKPAGVSVLSASPIELLAKLERCHCDMVDMGTSRNDWKEKFQRLGIEATQQISAAKERISSLRMFTELAENQEERAAEEFAQTLEDLEE